MARRQAAVVVAKAVAPVKALAQRLPGPAPAKAARAVVRVDAAVQARAPAGRAPVHLQAHARAQAADRPAVAGRARPVAVLPKAH